MTTPRPTRRSRPLRQAQPPVGFVHNHEGRDSRLRNLTIKPYRAEKDYGFITIRDDIPD